VRVDALTDIDPGIQIGDVVEVRGGIGPDGTLWAARIRLFSDETGWPFEFVGVVQALTDTVWTVSGISLTVDADTQIEAGIAVGDVVRVRGRLGEDGTWRAKTITLAGDRREFVIVGPGSRSRPMTPPRSRPGSRSATG
jgi:hypothetical protein